MPSQEHEELVEMMRTLNPLGSGDIETMRAGMAAAPPYPQPPDVQWQAVDADGVPCEWNVPDDCAEGRTIVYYHGGGYGIGSVAGHRGLCSNLARATRARVLSVDYRLAPEHPFPAAVDDALTAYRWTVGQGADPARTALGGDSAGGGLAIATLIALREAGEVLPAAGLCLSPWVDLTGANPRIAEVAPKDPMLSPAVLEVFAKAYLSGADPKAPTASPAFADLSGLPPLLIQAGTAEILIGEIEDFAKKAEASGVDVQLEIWDDMLHVWQTFADMLPEGREALAGVGKYVEARL